MFSFFTETIPEKNKLFNIIPTTAKSWELSLDIKVREFQEGTILHFLTPDTNTDANSKKLPHVYTRKGKDQYKGQSKEHFFYKKLRISVVSNCLTVDC